MRAESNPLSLANGNRFLRQFLRPRVGAATHIGRTGKGQKFAVVREPFPDIDVQVDRLSPHDFRHFHSRSPFRASNSSGVIETNRTSSPALIGKYASSTSTRHRGVKP